MVTKVALGVFLGLLLFSLTIAAYARWEATARYEAGCRLYGRMVDGVCVEHDRFRYVP